MSLAWLKLEPYQHISFIEPIASHHITVPFSLKRCISAHGTGASLSLFSSFFFSFVPGIKAYSIYPLSLFLLPFLLFFFALTKIGCGRLDGYLGQ
jgi:hypothetical protein